MADLTSKELIEVLVRGLNAVHADFRARAELLKGRNLSPVTERALAGLTADEVAQVIRDLSTPPTY
jgi:hypothetical protein